MKVTTTSLSTHFQLGTADFYHLGEFIKSKLNFGTKFVPKYIMVLFLSSGVVDDAITQVFSFLQNVLAF